MAEARGWRVTSQDHAEEYTNNGSFEPVVVVHYVTDGGTKGKVSFPEARYNMQAVADRINELVGRINDVASLGN
jgi:hypothetical protein